jgi:hypothetical protein
MGNEAGMFNKTKALLKCDAPANDLELDLGVLVATQLMGNSKSVEPGHRSGS